MCTWHDVLNLIKALRGKAVQIQSSLTGLCFVFRNSCNMEEFQQNHVSSEINVCLSVIQFEGKHKNEAVSQQLHALHKEVRQLQAEAMKPPSLGVVEAAVHVENFITQVAQMLLWAVVFGFPFWYALVKMWNLFVCFFLCSLAWAIRAGILRPVCLLRSNSYYQRVIQVQQGTQYCVVLLFILFYFFLFFCAL